MARRRLYGAALAAHRKRLAGGGKRRKHRRNPARKRHSVRAHVVHVKRRSYHRRRHMSNPMGFGIPSMKNVTDAAMAAAVLIGASWLTFKAVDLVEGNVPGTQSGIGNVLGKAVVAIGVVGVSRMVVKDHGLRTVVLAGAVTPLALDALSAVGIRYPMGAGQAALPAMPSAAEQARARALSLGMSPGNRLSDYTLDRSLEADLHSEMESGLY
jgi:hypothetical protein